VLRRSAVNYTNASGCTAAAPVVFNVTVNPLPVPTLAGPTPVCVNSTGNVYTTQAGMTGYAWTVSAGGTITAGGTATSNTVTVTWTAAGAQTSAVNYTNASGCTAAAPVVFNVTVNPLPVPTITGPASICGIPSAGNIYSTEAGMSAYVWTVSAGGTITAGAGTNSITVTWTTTGAKTVTVTYTVNGCNPASPTTKTVNVYALPVPTITGPTSICGIPSAGNIYSTEAGMSAYVWTVSAGGTITAGAGTNSITVTWTTTGAKTITVTYTDVNGCNPASPTTKTVNVYALPVPTITGPGSICGIPSAGNIYSTEAGMSSYIWTVSAGGTITAGAGTNSITVTWTTTGAKTITVTYTDINGCNPASPTTKTVNVYALPVPTITGPASICGIPSAGNVYSTEAGMSSYIWTVSAGGTITAGAGTNSITVTWTTTGAKTITVTYTDINGCNPASPTTKTINVYALPVPTITGPASICGIPSAGNVYSTEAGMSAYVWTVSAGGTITAGAGTNSITVTWTTTGAKTITVTYTDVNGCNPASPTTKTVNVYALPVPTITGPASICGIPSAGNIYSTEAGMSAYVWTVSAGGTITAGAGTNSITVTWTTTGAKTVTVTYTDVNGCNPASPTTKTVNVYALPVPTITGPASICGIPSAGNIYSTEAGMSAYVWTVSAGGTITAGAGTNSITVTWTTTGAKTVTVTYTDINGCNPASPTTKAVNVYALPVPTITGPASICGIPSAGNIYSTEAGMSAYVWTVSAGGTITAGAGTNSITVTWTTTGAKTITVTYTDINGCNPASPTIKTVNVYALPVPTITGPASICGIPSAGNVYSTEAGMSAYVWTVSAGGTITAGAGTNSITVTWTTTGAKTVTVTYTDVNGCNPASPTTKTVNVYALPVPTITGPTPVCVNSTGNIYTTEAGMTGYVWTVSAGGTITAGGTATSNTVTITWTAAGVQTVSVNYTNASGCTAAAPVLFNVTVNPLPVPTITGPTPVCVNSTGNVYTTQAGMTGYAWTVSAGGTITAGGTATSNTVTVTWTAAGAQTSSVNYTNANGCTAAAPVVFNVTVNPLPVPTLAGPTPVCVNSTGNVYTTQAGMTGYVWTVSAGGTITAGGTATSNTVTVTWTAAGAQTVSVNYTNASGCTAAAPVVFNVT
jgi:hypothetical protein